MGIMCERCGKAVSASEGEYVYYQGRMMLVCISCAQRLKDEVDCVQRVYAAIDKKKKQAESITNNKNAYAKFIKSIETTVKKTSGIGNWLADIPLLVSLVKSYVGGEYTDIPYNTIITVVGTLLYVVSPMDIIPDIIPNAGFSDDDIAVAFCFRMFHDDLEKFKSWLDQNNHD